MTFIFESHEVDMVLPVVYFLFLCYSGSEGSCRIIDIYVRPMDTRSMVVRIPCFVLWCGCY